MARERSELEQRRGELSRSLPGLSENRAETYRRNSDALVRDIDAKIKLMPRRRLGARVGRALRRARADR